MVYRAKARIAFGPAAIRRFDASGYRDRLEQSSALSTNATAATKVRAVERKVAAKAIQQQQAAVELERAKNAIQKRTVGSQSKVQQLQNQTAGQYAKINERRAIQQLTRQTPQQITQQSTSQQAVQQQAAEQPTQQSIQQYAPQVTLNKTQNSSGNYKRIKLGASESQNPSFQGDGAGRVSPTNGGTASKKAAGIINEAMKYRGRMYQWGGSTPQSSFDCSGLIQWAYKSMGVSIPRVSNDQARYGKKVPLSAMRPGDLMAWDNSSRNSGADHIAIYIGNGKVLEAARAGTPIRVSKLYDTSRAWGVQILK